MSFSYGFYNSIEHDRLYDAIQVSKIFDGIIMDGVYETIGDAFIVQTGEDPNLVIVGPGRAWFNHTWNENDGYLDVELSSSEAVIDRIDAVVIDVDERVSIRTNQILVVKGTPSSTPTKPTLLNEPEHHQYPLAYILRKAGNDVVEQADIENAVGTTECPFVTGVLETLDANLLLLQWRDAWAKFIEECTAHINEWENESKLEVANFVSEFKRQCNEFLAKFISDMETWETTQKDSFILFYEDFKRNASEYEQELKDWVNSLKDLVSEDELANLLIEMEKMKEDVENLVENTREYLNEVIAGFQAKTTTFSEDGNTIVETFEDRSQIVTKFFENGSIESSLVSSAGVTGAVKLTEFKEDGSIVETVTGGNYFEFALSKNNGVGKYINDRYSLDMPDIFNNLQSIRDVANSQPAMAAILDNDTAWNELKESPTAMNSFRNSDVALHEMGIRDWIFHPMLLNEWDFVISNPVLVDCLVEETSNICYVLDNSELRTKFMGNPVLLDKAKKVNENVAINVAGTESSPWAFSNIIDPAIYKYAIGWNLYSDQADSKEYTLTTSLYPLGEDGKFSKYILNSSDKIELPYILLDAARGFSYLSVKKPEEDNTLVHTLMDVILIEGERGGE